MFSNLVTRIRPASLLALIALFAALGGTGYAAVQIHGKEIVNKSIAGKKLKNKTVTGKKVKRNTLTGTQINEAKLGQVPSAANAVNATNAANATLAGNVSGRQLFSKKVTATPGANLTAALAAAPEVVLGTAGPLTLYGKCATDNSGPATYGFAFVKTTEGGALLNSGLVILSGSPAYLEPGTAELSRYVQLATAPNNASMQSTSFFDTVTARTPSGAAFVASVGTAAKMGTPAGGDGAFGPGSACLFTGQLDRVG